MLISKQFLISSVLSEKYCVTDALRLTKTVFWQYIDSSISYNYLNSFLYEFEELIENCIKSFFLKCYYLKLFYQIYNVFIKFCVMAR